MDNATETFGIIMSLILLLILLYLSINYFQKTDKLNVPVKIALIILMMLFAVLLIFIVAGAMAPLVTPKIPEIPNISS